MSAITRDQGASKVIRDAPKFFYLPPRYLLPLSFLPAISLSFSPSLSLSVGTFLKWSENWKVIILNECPKLERVQARKNVRHLNFDKYFFFYLPHFQQGNKNTGGGGRERGGGRKLEGENSETRRGRGGESLKMLFESNSTCNGSVHIKETQLLTLDIRGFASCSHISHNKSELQKSAVCGGGLYYAQHVFLYRTLPSDHMTSFVNTDAHAQYRHRYTINMIIL